MEVALRTANETIYKLREELKINSFEKSAFEEDDSKCRYYTGLPYQQLWVLYEYLEPYITETHSSSSTNSYKTTKNQGICRTCLRTICHDKAPFYHINSTSPDPNSLDTIKQKFTKCLPELALEITVDAQVCGFCAAALHWAYEFRKSCLKTEKMIYSYVTEVGGDIYKVDLEQIVKWNNFKTLKKLETVEVVSDTASADWDCGIQVHDDINVDLSSVENNIEIKEEPLRDESEISEIPGLQNRANEVIEAGIQWSIKTEEMQVKEEPIFIDLGKLNEEDKCALENITATNKINNISIKSENPTLNNKNHICNICRTSFPLMCDLRLHMILHNNNVEPYECDVCEFTSPTKIILRRHLLISHTKELEFRCKECRSTLNDLDNHDAQTCIKIKLCGASAAKKPKLQDSNKDQDLHKCNLCDYKCVFESVLHTHKKIHETDLYYKCNVCSESFKEKVDLVRHLNIHS